MHRNISKILFILFTVIFVKSDVWGSLKLDPRDDVLVQKRYLPAEDIDPSLTSGVRSYFQSVLEINSEGVEVSKEGKLHYRGRDSDLTSRNIELSIALACFSAANSEQAGPLKARLGTLILAQFEGRIPYRVALSKQPFRTSPLNKGKADTDLTGALQKIFTQMGTGFHTVVYESGEVYVTTEDSDEARTRVNDALKRLTYQRAAQAGAQQMQNLAEIEALMDNFDTWGENMKEGVQSSFIEQVRPGYTGELGRRMQVIPGAKGLDPETIISEACTLLDQRISTGKIVIKPLEDSQFPSLDNLKGTIPDTTYNQLAGQARLSLRAESLHHCIKFYTIIKAGRQFVEGHSSAIPLDMIMDPEFGQGDLHKGLLQLNDLADARVAPINARNNQLIFGCLMIKDTLETLLKEPEMAPHNDAFVILTTTLDSLLLDLARVQAKLSVTPHIVFEHIKSIDAFGDKRDEAATRVIESLKSVVKLLHSNKKAIPNYEKLRQKLVDWKIIEASEFL